MPSAPAVLTVAALLALQSCGPSYDAEARGPLMIAASLSQAVDGPPKDDLMLIETAPGVFTEFYTSAKTEFVNMVRVEDRVRWTVGHIYLVRGRKVAPRGLPTDGSAYIGFPGIKDYIDATYVEKIDGNAQPN
jgi:hypothetical protein